jgi:hypothetical protein
MLDLLTNPTPQDIRRTLYDEPDALEDRPDRVYTYEGADACRVWVTCPDCPGGRWWGGDTPAQMSPATAADRVRRISQWRGWTAEVKRLDPWSQAGLFG